MIQIRNPHKQHRGRNRTSCSRMLLPVCSTPSFPSLPPRVCPATDRSERPAARAPLFPGILPGNAGERRSHPNLPALRVTPEVPFGATSQTCNVSDASWGTSPCSGFQPTLGMGRAGLELPHVTSTCRQGGDFATQDSHQSSPHLCQGPAWDSSCLSALDSDNKRLTKSEHDGNSQGCLNFQC